MAKEISTLRSVIGSLSWIARQGRPDLSYRVSRLQTMVKGATIGTLKEANKIVDLAMTRYLAINLDLLLLVNHVAVDDLSDLASIGSSTIAAENDLAIFEELVPDSLPIALLDRPWAQRTFLCAAGNWVDRAGRCPPMAPMLYVL